MGMLDNLRQRVTSWQHLFAKEQVDLLLVDHSPTALLASQNAPIKTAILGTGFTCPPDVSPLPSLRRSVPDPPWSIAIENQVLENVNDILPRTRYSFARSRCGTTLRASRQYLLTLAELDHYLGRGPCNYWFPLYAQGNGWPAWPEADGHRIFVYLKFNSGKERLFEALHGCRIASSVMPLA